MWYKKDSELLLLHLYIQPGAKRTEIVGMHGEALKIRLNAPPIEGQANEKLRQFMAQLFRVPVRQVVLKKGDKSRHKTIVITGSLINPECLYSSC